MKAPNYAELVCDPPMLLRYRKGQREEDHGRKEQKERESSRTFVAIESSIFGDSAAVVRCSPARSIWGSGGASNNNEKVKEDVLEVG
jgi:hypothetical protein